MFEGNQRISQRFRYIFVYGLIITIFSVGFLFFLGMAVTLLSFPFDISGDSHVVYHLDTFLKGQPLYENYCNFPHRINFYGPVYYLISAFMAKLMNLRTFLSLQILCRTLTLFFTFLCSASIFVICRRIKWNIPISLIASFLFLSNPLLIAWGFSARVDLMAVFYSALAIYMILLEKGRISIYSAVFFSLLACYTKQSYISAAISIIIYFILRRKYRSAIEFIIPYICISLFIFFLLNYVTGWTYLEYFRAISFGGLAQISAVLRPMWWKVLPFFVLIVVSMVRSKDIPILLVIYAFVATAITFIALGGIWTSENYFLEPMLASAFMAARMLYRLCLERNKAIITLVLFLLAFTYLRYTLAWSRGRFMTDMEQYRPGKELIVKILKEAKGDVFVNCGLDIVIKAGKPVVNTNWAAYVLLAKNGKCSYGEILSKIQKREFGCIVMWRQRTKFAEKIEDAIANNYSLTQSIDNKLIYHPMIE